MTYSPKIPEQGPANHNIPSSDLTPEEMHKMHASAISAFASMQLSLAMVTGMREQSWRRYGGDERTSDAPSLDDLKPGLATEAAATDGCVGQLMNQSNVDPEAGRADNARTRVAQVVEKRFFQAEDADVKDIIDGHVIHRYEPDASYTIKFPSQQTNNEDADKVQIWRWFKDDMRKPVVLADPAKTHRILADLVPRIQAADRFLKAQQKTKVVLISAISRPQD